MAMLMNPSRYLYAFLLLLGLSLFGCTSAAQDISIDLQVDPQPATVGPSVLVVTLSDGNGNSLDGAQVKSQGSMSHEGMQPLHASFRDLGDGKYETPFDWNMAGDWELAISATLANGEQASQEFQFNITEKHDHDEHSEDHPPRVPNQGAVISILSPQDDMQFNAGDDIPVEVAFENFDLVEEGNHWHIYIDGKSYQMIMGAMTEAIVRDLEPGHHEISVYMSISSHEELQDGAAIHIMVNDPDKGD